MKATLGYIMAVLSLSISNLKLLCIILSIQRSQHIKGEAHEATLPLPPGLKPSAQRGQIGVAFIAFFRVSFQKDKTLFQHVLFRTDIVFGVWNKFDKFDIHSTAHFVERSFSSHLCVDAAEFFPYMVGSIILDGWKYSLIFPTMYRKEFRVDAPSATSWMIYINKKYI